MNAENVSFGKPKVGGSVYVAPKGSTMPKDATSELDPAFKNLGYISEDGLVKNIETDTTDIKAWGGDTVLSGTTSYAETFTVNLLETNEETLKTIYGAENVTGSEGTFSVKTKSADLPEMCVVFEVALTGGRINRICVEHAKIVDRSSEISYTDESAIIYPAKFNAFPGADGTYHTEYYANAA